MLAGLPSRNTLLNGVDKTLSDLVVLRRVAVKVSAKLKRRSKEYYAECLEVIEKTFPGVAKTPARVVSVAVCQAWAESCADKYGATRFNNIIGQLRRLFEKEEREDWLDDNPALSIEKRPVRPKESTLPTRGEFPLLVDEMRTAGYEAGDSKPPRRTDERKSYRLLGRHHAVPTHH